MAEDPNDPNAFTSHKAGDVYDNFKFLSMQQLESLNLSHLIGTTSLLRPYMHGFFVDQRLYEEAKLIADPFVWEEERNKKVKEKIDAERESRIRGNKKVTAKVNKKLAEKMMERQEREERREARKVLERGGDDQQAESAPTEQEPEPEPEQSKPGNALTDPRFSKLFQDEAFAIDERSHEFQMLNPSTKPGPREPTDVDNERKLTAVEEEALAEVTPSNSEDDSGSDEPQPQPKPKAIDRISTSSYKKSGHKPQQPQMHVTSSKKPPKVRDRTFGSRALHSKAPRVNSSTVVGEREITFAPQKKEKNSKPEFEKGHSSRRRDKDRRSASGNVFRAL